MFFKANFENVILKIHLLVYFANLRLYQSIAKS